MKIIVSIVSFIFIGFHSIAQTDSLNDKQIKDKVLQEIQQSLDKRTMSVDSIVERLDQRLDALDKSIAATKGANEKADKFFLRVQALEDKQKAIEQNEVNIYEANFQSAIVNLVSMDREIKPLILFNTTKTFFDQLDAAGNPLNYDGYRDWFTGFNKYVKDNKNNETLELSSNLLTFAGGTTQTVPIVGPISGVLFASMSTYLSSISKKNKELREESKEMITLTMKISQFDYDKQENEHEWKVITDELNNLQGLYQTILTKNLSLLNVNTTEFCEQFTNESDADKRYKYLTVLRQKACNYVESALFQLGVIASKNAYNQLELFRCSLPGNGVELKAYDWFQTTCDAALCFFLKESMPADEPSDFLIRFTDRQGVPVGFDPSDLPMRTNRINNRNKFVLGPSGSGKSFFMNALIQQYMGYNMDMVIVDTGHSYSGLCAYYNGKYITYSEENPITMNPFQITEAEYNIEKKDFLGTLIGLLWKGAEGTFSPVERDVIANVISAYYLIYFAEKRELKFDTFYEFALEKIPEIKTEEKIPFDLDEFRYVLKKFYKGGEFGFILNQAADDSLFGERFIVFEIDNIKESKILFPIVTVIIMDVFIQKMRLRKSQRKALVLEEAWKALASPIMANFLLYLNKTVRKFWGEIIEVTQELGDIIGNPIVKDSIISNSDTIILLDQSKFKDNYNDIAALLSINETERRKIFSINQLENTEGRGRFKEVYIRRGSIGEVYGVETAMEQYLTYTPEKPEKSAVEIYTGHYGSYPKGLDAMVRDMHQLQLRLPDFITKVNAYGKPLTI